MLLFVNLKIRKGSLDMWGSKEKEEQKSEFQESLLAVMDSMYNFGYRLTYNREDANDLVQEAALRGYRFYHQFEKGTNFKGWILTILRNTFINQYRKKVKEPVKVDYDILENMIGVPETRGFEEEIFGESLQESVDQLPEEMRTAIVLFYVEGLSYKEIAKVMGCPIGTVMSRLHMARQLLKKKLTEVVEHGKGRMS